MTSFQESTSVYWYEKCIEKLIGDAKKLLINEGL